MNGRANTPLGFGVCRPAGACGGALRQTTATEGRHSPGRWRDLQAFGLLIVVVVFAGVAVVRAVAQQSANDTAVRFRAVDIFVDSHATPLAAYQLAFAVTNGNAKIVGIEGGEHAAFAQPPFYDPKALQHERAIIAAFSTEPADKLPKGKTRVATIHIQTRGETEPGFETSLQTAAGADGRKLEAQVTSQERKPE